MASHTVHVKDIENEEEQKRLTEHLTKNAKEVKAPKNTKLKGVEVKGENNIVLGRVMGNKYK